MLHPESSRMQEDNSSGVFVSAVSASSQGQGNTFSPTRSGGGSSIPGATQPPTTHARDIGSSSKQSVSEDGRNGEGSHPSRLERQSASDVPSGTGGTAPPAVRHTDYLGNFIRDPARQRAAVQEAGAAATPRSLEHSEAQREGAYSNGSAPNGLPPAHFSDSEPRKPPLPIASGTESTSGGAAVLGREAPQQQGAYAGRPWEQANPPTHTAPPRTSLAGGADGGNGYAGPQVGTSAADRYRDVNPAQVPFSQISTGSAQGGYRHYNAGGASVVIDANGYINVDDIPVRLSTMGRRDRPWHYGLCECCHSCDACVESWCCLPCQVARQCNMLLKGKPSIHWPFCLLISATELCTGCTLVACLFVGQTRRMARERYGIVGSGVSDCCAAFWCRCCALQQVLQEMTIMNDFPGATCYQVEPVESPAAEVEMR